MNSRKKNRFIYWLLMFSAVAWLSGCASVTDYSNYVQEYENRYLSQHPYREHAIKQDKYFLYAREYGVNHSGPPFILMHGFPDSLHLYDRLAPLLAKKHRVISFDFLGWGKSDKPQDHIYDANSLLNDLQAVMNHFRLNDVILVAHDASGFPAIDWALAHPGNTELLVLLNTVYLPMKSVIPPEAIARFSTPGLLRNIRRWGAYQSDGMWQQGLIDQTSKFYSDSAVRDQYIKIFAQQALYIRPAFFGLNEVLRTEIDKRRRVAPKMKAYVKPVAIIFGEDDPYLNTGVAKEFADIFPKSSLTLVKNAGHYVQLDQPQDVANSIFTSLARD